MREAWSAWKCTFFCQGLWMKERVRLCTKVGPDDWSTMNPWSSSRRSQMVSLCADWKIILRAARSKTDTKSFSHRRRSNFALESPDFMTVQCKRRNEPFLLSCFFFRRMGIHYKFVTRKIVFKLTRTLSVENISFARASKGDYKCLFEPDLLLNFPSFSLLFFSFPPWP